MRATQRNVLKIIAAVKTLSDKEAVHAPTSPSHTYTHTSTDSEVEKARI